MEAAFFDLDKTVIAKSSTLAFGRPLYREGFIDRGQLMKGLYAQLVYLLTGADEEKMERMREGLLELTRGWEQDRLGALVQETLSDIIEPLIYAEAMDLVEEHIAAGRRVYIVSSSPVEIVGPLALFLGIPHVIATRTKVVDGRYAGELEFYCYGEGKREAIQAEAAAHGIDLAESFAYSDSITDAPMLEAVGHPFAVNPDKALRALAAERDWPVLQFANPVSIRRRLADRGREAARSGREAARSGREAARSGGRMARTAAREMPDRARRAARERPSPSAAAVVALALALLIGWAMLRRQRGSA